MRGSGQKVRPPALKVKEESPHVASDTGRQVSLTSLKAVGDETKVKGKASHMFVSFHLVSCLNHSVLFGYILVTCAVAVKDTSPGYTLYPCNQMNSLHSEVKW